MSADLTENIIRKQPTQNTLVGNFTRQRVLTPNRKPTLRLSLVEPCAPKPTKARSLDSGSSHHMFKDRSNFISHSPQSTKIEVANGDSMDGHGIGTVSGSHLGAPLTLSGALHVPDLKCNLVSLGQLAQKGCSLTFLDNSRFEVTQNDEVALSGSIVDGLMELDLDLGKSPSTNPIALAVVTDGVLLHSRLGHPGP